MTFKKIILSLALLSFCFSIGFWYGFKLDKQMPATEISHVYVEKEDPYAQIYRQALKKKYEELEQKTSGIEKNQNINLDNLNISRLDDRNLRQILSQIPKEFITKYLDEKKNEFYTNFIQPREPKVPVSVADLEDQFEEGLNKFENLVGENGRKSYSASTTLKIGELNIPVHLNFSLWTAMPIHVSSSGVSHFEVSDSKSVKTYNNLCFRLKVNFPTLDYNASKNQTKCLKDLGRRNKDFVELIELKNNKISEHVSYLDLELPTGTSRQTLLSYFDRQQNMWVNQGELLEWKEETSLQTLSFENDQ